MQIVKSFARASTCIALLLAIPAGVCAYQSAASLSNPRDTAFALEQQGNLTEAASAWRAILNAHPQDAEGCAHLGLIEARQQHYSEAIALYRKALAIRPSIPGLRLNLGLALFKSGDLKGAIADFTPLLQSEPSGSPEAQRLTALLGLAHYGVGEYAAAIPLLRTASANDAQNLQFRLLLAHSCLSERQFQCVLDVYHEILTLNAESAEADMLAGEALDEMRNHAAAIEQFRAAVKADPREPNVHFGLGYLLWTQNQFEEAAHEFQAELDNVPGNAQALAFLADSDMQLNHADLALPLLQKAIAIDPRLARAHLDLGILNADAGHREEAIREFKMAARLTPEDPSPHWRLARLYQAMGNKAAASAEFQKTSSLHKAANDTIFSKLKAAQQKGDPAEQPPVPLQNP
jgi:tetratricopeptide (TPR) repeat protein